MHITYGFPRGSAVKNPPAVQEMKGSRAGSPGREDPLEEGMAAHSSIRENPCGQRKLPGCSPCGHKESDTAEANEHAGRHNIKFTVLSHLKCMLQRYFTVL